MGIVERVAINVTIDNTGEDSFNPFLTFNLSKQNFAYEPSVSGREGGREGRRDIHVKGRYSF